jgi:hypothetical protein
MTDPLALLDAELEAEIDRGNASHFIRQAAHAAKRGEIAWTLYFLEAADFYVPESSAERIGLLLGAMEQITERTADRA